MTTIKSFFGTHSFPSTDKYVDTYPIAQLNGVTTSDVQMIKSLLKLEISRMESDRAYNKHIATNTVNPELKASYWKGYFKLTKKINKLAALQAKIKRNL